MLRKLSLVSASLVIACVDDATPTDPITGQPAAALSTVTVSPAVSIIAVGGTQQLTSAAFALDGTPIDASALDSVRYYLVSLADTQRVILNATTGLVTGRAATTAAVNVNALAFTKTTIQGARAMVQVTATSISELTLSIQPVAPDSAKLALQQTKTITPVVRNASTGQSVTNPLVWYTVKPSDYTKVQTHLPGITSPAPISYVVQTQGSPNPNQIRARAATGSAWIYADIVAYGTRLRDSVLYSFSYPFTGSVFTIRQNLEYDNAWKDQRIVLQAPATISFSGACGACNLSGDSLSKISYAFDNPAAAQAAIPPSSVGGSSGNVTPLTLVLSQSSSRRFTTPGIYKWTATIIGPSVNFGRGTFSGELEIR